MKIRDYFFLFFKALILLTLGLSVSAFIDVDAFSDDVRWADLVSQYEAKGPSDFYRGMSGIEVEGYYSQRPTRSFLPFADLTDVIPTVLPGFKSVEGSPLSAKVRSTFIFAVDGVEYKLGLHNDDSIYYPKDKTPIEIVSPVLTRPQDFDVFYKVLESLRDHRELTPEPLHSGTHFHFDFLNAERTEVLILTALLEKIYPEIIDLFNIQKYRIDTFARPYSVDDFKKLDVHFRHVEIAHTHWRNTEELALNRNEKAINWKALTRHGTLEYRAFGSSIDPEVLITEHDLLYKLVKAVRTRDPRLIDMLKTTSLKEINLNLVAKTIDAKIQYQKTKDKIKNQITQDVQRSISVKQKLQTRSSHSQFPTLSHRSLPPSNVNAPELPFQTSIQPIRFHPFQTWPTFHTNEASIPSTCEVYYAN